MSYNEKLEDRIDHHFIDNEELVKRKRLGWVGYLISGNMCFGIYDQLLIVRVSPSLAHALVEKEGVDYFDQDDKTKGAIISVSSRIYDHPKALHKFLSQALEYTSTLPPRENDQSAQRSQSGNGAPSGEG